VVLKSPLKEPESMQQYIWSFRILMDSLRTVWFWGLCLFFIY